MSFTKKEQQRLDQLWTIPKQEWNSSDFLLWNRSVNETSGISAEYDFKSLNKRIRDIYLEEERKRMAKKG